MEKIGGKSWQRGTFSDKKPSHKWLEKVHPTADDDAQTQGHVGRSYFPKHRYCLSNLQNDKCYISKSSAFKSWGNQTKNLAVLSSLVMEGEVSLSRDEWCQEFLPPQEETAQSSGLIGRMDVCSWLFETASTVNQF